MGKASWPYYDAHPSLVLQTLTRTPDQAIRVHEEELGQFAGEKNLIRLSDGSGYYVTMAVFHGLHCVRRLHHFIHRDVYYEGISEGDSARLKSHTGT